ncbi:MAG TPA: hypothetical protein VIM42_09190 [Clostridium sp.]
MLRLEKWRTEYNLFGTREDLLSLTPEGIEEIFRLADEVDAEEERERRANLFLITKRE